VIDAESNEIVRRVPLTIFEGQDIPARRDLILSVRARSLGIEAFRESYPLYLTERGFISDENADFALLVFKKLVEGGFVSSPDEWARVYQFFTANVDYFGKGGAEKIERILKFLEARYEIDLASANRTSHFVRFYVSFLNEILSRDIGDRPSPDGRTLKEYVVSRLKSIYANDMPAILLEAAVTLKTPRERNIPDICLNLSSAQIKALTANEGFLDGIVDGSDDEYKIKLILKRSVDCAQLYYLLEKGDDSASMGKLFDGVEFLRTGGDTTSSFLRDYMALFSLIERRGLFPRSEDGGDWRQIYQYYDIIRSSGAGEG
jgi:hypothetical protein